MIELQAIALWLEYDRARWSTSSPPKQQQQQTLTTATKYGLLLWPPSSWFRRYPYFTHSFILRKEEAPVCVACNVVLTVKHILIECADLLEIRKKYFEEKSLYSLLRNVIPEVVFDFLSEIGVFYKVWSVLR